MTLLFSGNLDTAEPWQGSWAKGVLVECEGGANDIDASDVDRNSVNPEVPAIRRPGK